MKKYLSIALICLFVLPSVASASWWNPLTWFSSGVKTSTELHIKQEKTFVFWKPNTWFSNNEKENTDGKEVLNNEDETSAENIDSTQDDTSTKETIDVLQKEIDDLKKQQEVAASVTQKQTTTSTHTDTIPAKKTETSIIDVCDNIEGIQTIVPIGYVKYGLGDCLLQNSPNLETNVTQITLPLPPVPTPVLVPQLSQEKASDIKNQISLYIKKLNDEIDILRNTNFDTGNINHTYTTLRAVDENPGYLNWNAISGYTKLQNQVTLLDEIIRRLNVISFKVQDYADYGTILSADERVYLADIGIKF